MSEVSCKELGTLLGCTEAYILHDSAVPDWVRKELAVEFTEIIDRLHRLDDEQRVQFFHVAKSTLILSDDDEYWTAYVAFITSVRHYMTDLSPHTWEKVVACRGDLSRFTS